MTQFDAAARKPMDAMNKPDPYGEWALLETKQGPGGQPLAIDEDLLAAAREAWPHVLAHVRGELFDKESGPERTALAADIWDRVLRSVAKTRQRNRDHRPPISDLESYLIGVFHHRFNRLLKKEQKRAETIEVVSSAVDLERFEAALDTEWAEQLERTIAVRQITDRMDGWTKKVWQGASIRVFVERNFGVARCHGATGKNEIPVQLGQDPAERCAGDEASGTCAAALKWSAIVFV